MYICWSYLRRGNIPGLVLHYFRHVQNSVARGIAAHPFLLAKVLRVVPLLAAVLIVCGVFAFGGLETPGKALGSAAASACALWLAVGSLGSILLAGQIVIPLAGLWRYVGIRASMFFIPAGTAVWLFAGQPERQAWAIAVCAILWFTLYGLVERLAEALIWQKRRRLKRLNLGADKHVLTTEEIWRVAVHEAGHLLLYGELERLPEDAIGVIDKEPKYALGGFVLPVQMENALEATSDMLRWQATLAYAGGTAERLIFGAHSEGAASDHEQADKFIVRLASVLHIDYFPAPANPSEEQANIAAICRLRESCRNRAEAFLKANMTQLLQISEMLKASECVDSEQFYPIWQTLLLPEEWQKIPVPARVPCLVADGRPEWTERS
ncbi:hypothetical protein [Pandoraea apista]|uniref:hypothetical protein n=1 Tax=Pandoraea apista TaxID=93218 RepID=UPI000F62218C|nr:hypothetical protein [Pandoraea apista]RRJ34372.1 hypothetical protein EIB05_03765 [Pandoraea apista]RRJ81483.1 hypothetical protein EIL82_03760 [Pandoraea apista]RSD08232.1 hypothetical protein EIZ52_24765 [Pandoraea apista]RSD16640.1 hypothetical protein EJB12_05245 [Pandoraea apista]RSK87525.1 hypothetical protein EJE96_02055 [Pandoraea apista]